MRSIEERLIDKVFHSPDGCWYWLGSETRVGQDRSNYWMDDELERNKSAIERAKKLAP